MKVWRFFNSPLIKSKMTNYFEGCRKLISKYNTNPNKKMIILTAIKNFNKTHYYVDSLEVRSFDQNFTNIL